LFHEAGSWVGRNKITPQQQNAISEKAKFNRSKYSKLGLITAYKGFEGKKRVKRLLIRYN
jgi:hypothetical protein